MDNEEIEKALVRIEHLVKEYTPGNHRAQREEALALISGIRQNKEIRGHASEFLVSLQGWINIYFSATKHQQYARADESVRDFILVDCFRLRSALS